MLIQNLQYYSEITNLFSAKDKNGVTLWIKVELLVSKVESLCTKIDFKEKYDYGRN